MLCSTLPDPRLKPLFPSTKGGIFDVRIHYPRSATKPTRHQVDMYASRIADRIEGLLKPPSEPHPIDDFFTKSERAISNYPDLGNQFKKAIAKIDKTFITTPKAWINISPTRQSRKKATKRVYKLATGKLGEKYLKLAEIQIQAETDYQRGACRWTGKGYKPISKKYLAPNQIDIIRRLKAGYDRAVDRFNQAVKRMPAYTPLATIDVRAETLDSAPKITVTPTREFNA